MGTSSAAAGTVQAVVFDYGGVLTNSGGSAIRAWTARERIDPDTFSAALKEWLSRDAPAGTPVHRLETGELSAEEFNRLLADRLRTVDGQPVAPDGLIQRMFAEMRLEPAMLDLVRRIRDSGVRTAMLSNSWGNAYPWDELSGLFEFAVVSAELGLRKPDERIYRHTLDRLGLAAPDVVLVDDGAPNTEAAQRLGLRTVLHTDPADTRDQLGDLLAAPHDKEPQ
ncbi:HAD family phosphatase [Saccharopolyspora sp. HNM0983]|uniref:HAD family phosphatase n=1 Tax=Saccharopolyspora montiporae TaxID=2781240 RepID=A0A929BBX2_9PSEU|nr:HAD family phosphatase [Saccharopolyspora sp. HNM0983]MBE9375535.1 HAD family phosphatase [Saccharopolyspora sp. HNM0983]